MGIVSGQGDSIRYPGADSRPSGCCKVGSQTDLPSAAIQRDETAESDHTHRVYPPGLRQPFFPSSVTPS